MDVFIDASGDPGFDRSGSSVYYSAVAVIFRSDQALRSCTQALDEFAVSVRHRGEFRYSHLPVARREQALDVALRHEWEVACLVFDKQLALWRNPAGTSLAFEYSMYVRLIVSIPALQAANVVIDGVGGNARDVAVLVRRDVRQGDLKSLRFADSRKSRAIQLADLVAGIAARANHSADAQLMLLKLRDRLVTDQRLWR